MAAKSKRETSLDLSKKVAKVHDSFRKGLAKLTLKNKLTVSQFDALSVLENFGPVKMNKIASELMVTGANITCVIDNLEKEKLVERTFSKEDRRAILVKLTKKGNLKINSLQPKYADALTEISQKLTISEQNKLLGLMDKLTS